MMTQKLFLQQCRTNPSTTTTAIMKQIILSSTIFVLCFRDIYLAWGIYSH